jgi:hypothetical protein
MKHIVSYNESIYGELSRLNPTRYKNDQKFAELFEEMKEDFEKNGRDLRKVHIIDHKGVKIDFNSISVGDDASITYIFGKYHPVLNNIHSGNRRIGNKRVKISYVPFEIVLKKNELEKFFGTGRINPTKVRVKIEEVIKNPDYNPNIRDNIERLGLRETEEDRKKMREMQKVGEEYKVSPDVAGKVLKFFMKEYKQQYPELTNRNKGPMDIEDIRKGVPPVIKTLNIMSKDGKSLYVQIRKGEDEAAIRKLVSNMTEKEYDAYWKERQEKLYKKSSMEKQAKDKKFKDKVREAVRPLLDKHSIKPEIASSSFDNEPLSVKVYADGIVLEFRVKSNDKQALEKRVKELTKEDFTPYKFKDYRFHDGFGDRKNEFWIILFLEVEGTGYYED